MKKFWEFWLKLAGWKRLPNFSTNTDEKMKLSHIWRDGDRVPTVAVTIAKTPHGNTHAGILYRNGDGSDQLHLAHLAFHKDLRDEEVKKPTCHCEGWKSNIISVIPNIDEIDALNVAIHCRGIIRLKPDLPYGLSYNEDGYFEVTEGNTGLILPEERKWLNCSTFVLTVFKSAGVALLDADGWPARPEEDREWQAKLVQMLSIIASQDHIERVNKDIGCARIRPEEAAGSCLEEDLPARFEQCEQNGKLILEIIGGNKSFQPHQSSPI